MSEPYVITRLCRDCVDGACVEVCPVDCIYEHRSGELPNQLFVNPEECIYCGACEPACPWEAIYARDHVPEVFRDDIELNAITDARPEEFSVPVMRLRARPPHPSAQQVADNKRKWEASTDASVPPASGIANGATAHPPR
jgi:ferredoxin